VPLQPLGVDGWRWLFLFGALGALIIFLLRTGLPESPRWLASVGRDAEAEVIVERFERAAQEGGLELAPPSIETPATASGSDASELFKAPYARRTWMMVVFQFLQTWGYYGFGTLVPSVLAARGFDIVTSLGFLSVIFIGYPVGSLLSLPIIELVERKYLVCGSALAMAVFGIAFGVSGSETAILILGFCYTAVSNVFSNAYHVYQAEIFPTRLRATAASGTYSLSRLSSGLMPFILLPLLDNHGSEWLFTVVAAAMVVVAVNVLAFGPRTTGRTLTDVNLVKGDPTVAPKPVAKEVIG
jgi:Sugar (and other) transporter.